MASPCCDDGPDGHSEQEHHNASACFDLTCPFDHPLGGPFPHPCDLGVELGRVPTVHPFKYACPGGTLCAVCGEDHRGDEKRVLSPCEKYPHDGCGCNLDDGLPLRTGRVSSCTCEECEATRQRYNALVANGLGGQARAVGRTCDALQAAHQPGREYDEKDRLARVLDVLNRYDESCQDDACECCSTWRSHVSAALSEADQ